MISPKPESVGIVNEVCPLKSFILWKKDVVKAL